MALIFAIIFPFLAIILFSLYIAKKKESNIYFFFKQQWGKGVSRERNFNKISSFFFYKIKEAEGIYYVDEQTAKDLDFHNVYTEIDHTNSKIGQQVLYYMLRCPPGSKDELLEFNQLIEIVSSDEKIRLASQKQLNKLKKDEDYYIVNFLFFDFPSNPPWLRYVWILQLLLVLSVVASFIYPIGVLLIMTLFCFNFVIHYKTKNRFHSFYVALGRISLLYISAQQIIKFGLPGSREISQVIKECKKVISKFWLFNLNNLYYSDLTKPIGVIIELLKIITLVEVQATYKVCTEFEKYKNRILQIYFFVGQIDAAISVASFRKSIPFYSIPEFVSLTKYFHFEEVYHPLIKTGVANNLCSKNEKSIFINGTNMSGKTTFLRTVGINVMLARSICTCLSKRAELSFFNIYTSIRIEDNIEEGISYYFQELLRLKEFIQTAEISKNDSLFLIDEILKGTNIYDRTKIAKSVLSFLNDLPQALTMVTSHDIDLATQLKDLFDFYYFTETVVDAELRFDYRIRKGLSNATNAVNLLSVLEFPKKIIDEIK